MSPEAGSPGLDGTRPAAAAHSEAHFDDPDQLTLPKGFVEGVFHPINGQVAGMDNFPVYLEQIIHPVYGCTGFLYRILMEDCKKLNADDTDLTDFHR